MKCPSSTFILVLLLSVTLFAQVNPVPTINGSVSPQSVVPGSSGFTLSVRGAGFVPGAVVNWNGAARTTTFVSAGELQAQILASDVAVAGSALITVTNPSPGGGLSSSSFGMVEIHQPISKVVLTQPRRYGSGGPAGLMADLNGDNKLDLVQTGRGLEVLLGNGDGTFTKSATFLRAPASTFLSFGDFNGDGKEDFVSLDQAHAHIFLGDGNGNFQEAPSVGNFDFPLWITVGDFNRDGILDLEVSEDNTNFYILLGNGDGTFQPQQVNTSVAYPDYPTVGDFNADGILDLAFNDPFLEAVDILLGNGDGTFQPPITTSTGPISGVLLVNDFNGDGKLDVAFEPASVQRDIAVLIGNGDGTFQSPQLYSTGFVALPFFTIGDFNSDGITDLFAYKQSAAGVASLQLGNGDGTFQTATRVLLPGPQADKGQVTFVGDFNSDGLLDLDVPLTNGSEVFLQKPQ